MQKMKLSITNRVYQLISFNEKGETIVETAENLTRKEKSDLRKKGIATLEMPGNKVTYLVDKDAYVEFLENKGTVVNDNVEIEEGE